MIQAISSANTWMRGGDSDTAWLYGYDAWSTPWTLRLPSPGQQKRQPKGRPLVSRKPSRRGAGAVGAFPASVADQHGCLTSDERHPSQP